jgi:GNAT superfamily N-acetyltransferase
VTIRRCDDEDFERIWVIVNDGAQAYKGIIPADRWKEPYMPRQELRREIEAGVTFWGCEQSGSLTGVMGIQDVQDVTLIRHAYTRTDAQKQGIGARLLDHLLSQTARPVLVGTWTDAVWAIRFYLRHSFELTTREEKEHLLRTYWKIPERQVETSVVLADQRWRELNPRM